jgi:hypothetical protein
MRTANQCRRDYARRPCDASSVSNSSESAFSSAECQPFHRQRRRRRVRHRSAALLPWPQVALVVLAIVPTIGLGLGAGLRAQRAIQGSGAIASAAPTAPTAPAIAQAPASRAPETLPTRTAPAAAITTPPLSIRYGYPETFRQIRTPLNERKLKDQLERAREIVLEPKPGAAAAALLEHARAKRGTWMEPAVLPSLLTSRSEFVGLPYRKGADCYLFEPQAIRLEQLSGALHNYLVEAESKDPSPAKMIVAGLPTGADYLWARLMHDGTATWCVPGAVPALVQILQVENESYRRLLVRLLSGTQGETATEELARRAAFDISPIVREEAVYALRLRAQKDCRSILLNALRHPWPAAAEFAAEAIVNLNMTSVIPELLDLLSLPSPSEPNAVTTNGKREYVVREMVQVNHLKNCLLCHPASADAADRVRGLVPDPDQVRLPQTDQTPKVSARFGYFGSSGGSIQFFARAEVTFLKQDFSVLQPIVGAEKRVRHERFDYLVRTRTVSAPQTTDTDDKKADYPQRDSVLFALREMTGADLGRDAGAWARALPRRE